MRLPLGSSDHLRYDADNEVLICNGASQALSLILESYVDPGDKIVLFDPSYVLHFWSAASSSKNCVGANPTKQRSYDVRCRPDKALRGAKLIFVNTPNNPTGGVLSKNDLKIIASLAKKHNALIVSDEVYEKFLYGQHTHTSLATFAESYDRTLTVNSFSKTYALAGYRIGFVAAPEHLLKPLRMQMAVRSPFVSIASQMTALTAMKALPKFRPETSNKMH